MALRIFTILILSYLIIGILHVINADGFIYYDWRRKGKKQIKVSDYYPQPKETEIAEILAFRTLEKMDFSTPTQMLIAMDKQRIYEHLRETHGTDHAQGVLNTISDQRMIINHYIGNILLWLFWA